MCVGFSRIKVKRFTTNGKFKEGYQLYREFADLFCNPAQPIEPRDLMDIRSDRAPIPIDEVEPLERILARFSSAAMSLGALA